MGQRTVEVEIWARVADGNQMNRLGTIGYTMDDGEALTLLEFTESIDGFVQTINEKLADV